MPQSRTGHDEDTSTSVTQLVLMCMVESQYTLRLDQSKKSWITYGEKKYPKSKWVMYGKGVFFFGSTCGHHSRGLGPDHH